MCYNKGTSKEEGLAAPKGQDKNFREIEKKGLTSLRVCGILNSRVKSMGVALRVRAGQVVSVRGERVFYHPKRAKEIEKNS